MKKYETTGLEIKLKIIYEYQCYIIITENNLKKIVTFKLKISFCFVFWDAIFGTLTAKKILAQMRICQVWQLEKIVIN